VRIGLIALMAVGSALMWIGLPVGLIYLASQLTDSTQPSMGPYMLVLFGLPAGMAAIGKGLGSLDRLYARINDEELQRHRPGWTRSMRGERHSTRRWTVLDRVMLVSVLVCLAASAVWFFGFAGSSLPGA
jgi:hypothetical protein